MCCNSVDHIEYGIIPKPNITFPWLDSLEQNNQIYHVHYVNSSTIDLTCPTPYSYNSMLTGGVDPVSLSRTYTYLETPWPNIV